MINHKQITMVWHVDDIKMSHDEEEEFTRMIKWLKSIYRKDMRLSRGRVHDYLGMTLDCTKKGEVKVTMIDYLKKVISRDRGHGGNPSNNKPVRHQAQRRADCAWGGTSMSVPPRRGPTAIRDRESKEGHSTYGCLPDDMGEVAG
jgi:hypothetical protein